MCIYLFFSHELHMCVLMYTGRLIKGTLSHKKDVKIRYSEHLKVNVFKGSFLEQNYLNESISIENISFSRNCDIKITKCEERHRRFYLGAVISKNSNTLEIKHILLNSSITIPRYGSLTDLADKTHSYDSGSIY